MARRFSHRRSTRVSAATPWQLLPALSLPLAILLGACPARAADTVVAGDLAWAKPMNTNGVDPGWGFDVRLGQRLNGELVVVTGEFAAGYYNLGGDLDPTVYRGMVGARLGIGAILRPYAFGHLGVGRATLTAPANSQLDRTAFAYDLGLGIDFTLLPLVTLGAYGGYNYVGPKNQADPLKWSTWGLNVELVF